MRITSYHVCETLDWIPLVSTIAQIVHAIASIRFKTHDSCYGAYLNKHSLSAKFLIACPIVNVFYKIIALFLTQNNASSSSSLSSLQNGALSPLHKQETIEERQKNVSSILLSTPIPETGALSPADKQQALEQVQKDGWAILSTSPEIQINEDIAKAAVTQDPFVITALSLALQANERIALAALRQDTTVFSCLPTPLKDKPSIRKAAGVD